MPDPAGIFAAVVGPSGAGKDSLINAAARHFRDDSRFMFVRRVVTREADKAVEDHDTVSVAGFDRLREGGAFAVSWAAHGILYGIPKDTGPFVENGGIAVANCSRAAIDDARSAFGKVAIIHIWAEPSVLAERLIRRGREDTGKISARLDRAAADFQTNALTFTVKNDGALEEASTRFIGILEDLAGELR